LEQFEFMALAEAIGDVMLIRLPAMVSGALPSRGLQMGDVLLDKKTFNSPLEPDGRGGHFLVLPEDSGVKAGENVHIALKPVKDWPDPAVPDDLIAALEQAGLIDQWDACTTKARWDWLRWLQNTNNPDTRGKRVQATLDKLKKGMKRPCCFNAAGCTNPKVSKNGKLIE
jgi:hypothetical protein